MKKDTFGGLHLRDIALLPTLASLGLVSISVQDSTCFVVVENLGVKHCNRVCYAQDV